MGFNKVESDTGNWKLWGNLCLPCAERIVYVTGVIVDVQECVKNVCMRRHPPTTTGRLEQRAGVFYFYPKKPQTKFIHS